MKKQEPDYRAESKRLKLALRNECSINRLLRKQADTHHDCFRKVSALNEELAADIYRKRFEIEVLHSILIRAGVKYNLSEEIIRVHKVLKALKKGGKRAG